MEENDLVVLDNDERYSLIKSFTDNKDNYFVAAKVNEDDSIDKNKLVALKVIKDEDGDYVEIVDDINKLKSIYQSLKDNANK